MVLSDSFIDDLNALFLIEHQNRTYWFNAIAFCK